MAATNEIPKLPDSAAVQRAIEVCTQEKAAKYLSEQFQKRVSSAGITASSQELQGVLDKYADQVKNIAATTDRTSSWGGVDVETAFNTFQAHVADEVGTLLAEDPKVINFVFAVEESSGKLNLLRGSQTDEGEALDLETEEQLDNLFLAWMSKAGWLSVDGCVYKADEQGNVLEKDGNPIKVAAKEFEEQILDANNGFKRFCDEQTDGKVELNTFEQDYPSDTAQPG